MEVSEGPGDIVAGADASVKRVARRGHRDAVWAPAPEEERSAVTGGGRRAPAEGGGRVDGSARVGGPGESRGAWEALGSPGKEPPGLRGGEGEAGAFGRPVGEVCVRDTFVLRRSRRRGGTGLGGGAGGRSGQELQSMGTWVSPRGLRAALPNTTSPGGASTWVSPGGKVASREKWGHRLRQVLPRG